jgi:hypothetical protein
MARYRAAGSSEPLHSSPVRGWQARSSMDQRTSRVHWQAPATMISSLLLGIIFAIGHDRCYNHYNHRPVATSFEQKALVDVGTAFAFMVKMFLAIATATAFSQQIWLSLKRKAESISDIDTLFDILQNAFCFGNVTLWVRHWMLALIALVTW